ncbi:hypothetical protein [Streptomyces asiaticus]|uniref:hypothetical protein n=1 Tax=Streptomyces asiaticus TaxID=114695 RepID=UPI001BA7BC65|nr:hypothetical protein [Streptomyces asiaticus]
MRAHYTITSILLTGLAVAGCGSDDGKASSKPSRSPSATSASPSQDPAAEFLAWSNAGGSDTIDTVLKDLDAVDKDSHPVDIDGLKESCALLTADLEVAKDEDPMPDKAMAQRWGLAVTHLTASARACTEGANNEDQASFDTMAAEMAIGNKHLDAVVKRLNEVTGG